MNFGQRKSRHCCRLFLVMGLIGLSHYGDFLQGYAIYGFNSNKIQSCTVFTEVAFKGVATGVDIENDLTEHVANGDMLEIFGFDFDLAFGGVGISQG